MLFNTAIFLEDGLFYWQQWYGLRHAVQELFVETSYRVAPKRIQLEIYGRYAPSI